MDLGGKRWASAVEVSAIVHLSATVGPQHNQLEEDHSVFALQWKKNGLTEMFPLKTNFISLSLLLHAAE